MFTIGKRSPPSGELVALLGECHERIRKFLGHARAAAERADLPEEEIAVLCEGVDRYFREALPLHVRDEEESVLPRVRGTCPAVDAALDTMRAQHRDHEPTLDRMLVAAAAVREMPGVPDRRARLRAAVDSLEPDLVAHLSMEETVIFPALAALPAGARAGIVDEVRARRR